MANFIRDQLKDPVIRYDNLDALDDIDVSTSPSWVVYDIWRNDFLSASVKIL